MNHTIVSLIILAVSAASSAAQGHDGPHHGGDHHGGESHHHGGGYGVAVGMPFGMRVPVQPALNLSQIWLQSAVQCEQASRLYVANTALVEQYSRALKEKRVQTSSARRDAERQKRLARQRQRQSEQAAVATEHRTEQGNEFRSTSVLSADGTIAWPTLLCNDDYKTQCDALEAVLANRTAAPQIELDRDDSRQVALKCNELLAKLTTHARDANPNDWIVAKRFVESVAAKAGR